MLPNSKFANSNHLPWKGIFGQFGNFPSFMSAQVLKIRQKLPCMVTVIALDAVELKIYVL